jgi:hypothetical protein
MNWQAEPAPDMKTATVLLDGRRHVVPGCGIGDKTKPSEEWEKFFSSGAGFNRCKSLISHLANHEKATLSTQVVYDKNITV